jgi:EpsI family protein
VGMLDRRAEKGHGQGEIAKTPQLDDEQAGRGGIMGWFCQACRVKFSIRPMTSHTPRATGTLGWALACALAGAAVFQFCGNASRGYIDTASLFYWWGFQWVNPTSETQHGWLILALSAWLFWRNLQQESGERKAESGEPEVDRGNRKAKIKNPKLAACAMLGGLALHLFGYFVQQTRLSIVALLLFTWGAVTLAGGRRWGRAARFPLAFLLFAVPVSFLDTAGFWLRLWVIDASYGLAHLAGLDVLRSGTRLFAPDGAFQYDVAAACSGVRSLMALLALSLLGGYLYLRAWWLRGLMLLLGLPFIYVGNVVRIAAVIFAAQWFGQKAGAWVHDWAGFLVFVIVLGLVMGTIGVIRRCWPLTAAAGAPATRPLADSASPTTQAHGRDARATRIAGQAWHGRLAHVREMWGKSRRWAPPEYAGPPWGVSVAVLAGALVVATATRWIDARPPMQGAGVRLAAGQVDPVELPTFLGNAWIGRRAEVTAVEREILPPDTGYSRKLYVSLDDPGHSVFLSVVLSGRDRSSIHRPELCLVGQGWTIEGAATHRFRDPGRAGGDFPATVLRVRREVPDPAGRHEASPEIVVYWFVGHDRIVAAYGQRMWFDALARLGGRADRWAYVLAQTDARDGETAALARIQSVLDGTLPAFQAPR